MTPPVSPRGLAEDKADGAGTSPNKLARSFCYCEGLLHFRMDNDEIALLNEQLREKDKQIAELHSIIRNLTQDEDDENPDADNLFF